MNKEEKARLLKDFVEWMTGDGDMEDDETISVEDLKESVDTYVRYQSRRLDNPGLEESIDTVIAYLRKRHERS